MHRNATPWLRGLLAALGLVCLFGMAKAQPGGPQFDPTHYWTYHILDQFTTGPQPIFVRDQFFKQGVAVSVDSLDRLLNWVQKNNSAVTDTLIHYTWWNIIEKLPVNRLVTVTNQFGSFPVQVLNLEFLLAPAFKNFTNAVGQPPTANHYLCYKATGFPGPPVGFDMRDEWHVDFQKPQDLQYLCAPCLKQHLGQTFPVVDTVTHFAVYPITPTSQNFVPFILDQFLNHQHFVTQFPIEYLFVPSDKIDRPTASKRSTWGRLKELYR